MSLEAILMMVFIMILIWGGFLATLVAAMRQESRAATEEGELDGDGDA